MPGATPFPLSRPKAAAILRQAAQAEDRVAFTIHAVRQMRRRHITRLQVFNCLARGRIVEGPAPDVYGNWTCRVEGFAAGQTIGVAAAIIPPDEVVIITVFWVD
jgi:hypothetical protein